MTIHDHSVETYDRADGKRGWRITVGGDIVATDGGQGYENEKDCLAGLFGNFFGIWDDTFLDLYQKWQEYGGGQYDVTPETQEGVPVMLRSDMPQPPTDDEQAAADDAVLGEHQTTAGTAEPASDDDVVRPGGDGD